MKLNFTLELNDKDKIELNESEAMTLYLKLNKFFGNNQINWSYPHRDMKITCGTKQMISDGIEVDVPCN